MVDDIMLAATYARDLLKDVLDNRTDGSNDVLTDVVDQAKAAQFELREVLSVISDASMHSTLP